MSNCISSFAIEKEIFFSRHFLGDGSCVQSPFGRKKNNMQKIIIQKSAGWLFLHSNFLMFGKTF